MTMISEDHMEWAVVDRLGKLLERPDFEWNVTDTLSSFGMLLCWTMQRMRMRGDQRGNKLNESLQKEYIYDIPWSIKIIKNEQLEKSMPIDSYFTVTKGMMTEKIHTL